MTAVKKWVAAGSSAAVLAGGLFLGTPAAYADTCAPAGNQAALVAAADNVHDAGVHFNSLVTDSATLASLQSAQEELESAILHDDTKNRAETAWNTILGLQAAYTENSNDADVDAAYAATTAAAEEFRTTALNSGVHMEDGAWLVALFESTCGPLITGTGLHSGTGTGGDWTETETGVSGDWTETGTGVGGDWTGTGSDWTASGSDHDSWTASGSNEGWNMQTAEEGRVDSGLLAGLLAAGAAVAGAVAFRVRRTHA